MKSLCYFICMMFLIVFSSTAQINIKDKLKNKSVERADQNSDEAIDKGFDKAEESVSDLFKKNKKNDAESEQKEEDDANEEGDQDNEEVSQAKNPDLKLESYTKYDFIPGDRVLFFDDFSQDAIGDFPALWTTNGNGEIRTLNNYPGNWFYMNSSDNVYNLMKDISLPDNFIVEFDIVPSLQDDGNHSGCYLSFYQSEGDFLDDGLYPGSGGFHIFLTDYNWSVQGYAEDQNTLDGETDIAPIHVNKNNHVIIWIQKRRARIYHEGKKALDLPTVLYPQVKYNRLRFSLWGHEGLPYITNIRITSASPDIRSKLITEGKIVSYGIYFDVNKDVVKAESYGTLKGIAQVLTENPDVKINIVGHTDSDGAEAVNLDLSVRRSASVKNELVKTFGIDASRIQTEGKGESVSVAPNDTPSNKALNRRVEFLKL